MAEGLALVDVEALVAKDMLLSLIGHCVDLALRITDPKASIIVRSYVSLSATVATYINRTETMQCHYEHHMTPAP